MPNKITQQNIPDGWKKVQLGELTNKIGSGITPRGGSAVYTDKGVMLIRSQNVHNDSMRFDDVAYISAEIDEDMKTSRVKKGDVLYNISGASIGRSNVFDYDLPANVNQHVCIIRLKEDSPWFINYWLRSFAGMRELYSFQAGGNREGLNYSQLGSFEIDLPELQEQGRIVKVLRTWDEAIEKLGQMIELKRNIKKGLMQKLLTGELRLPGFKGEWKKTALGDTGKVVTGSTPAKKDDENYGEDFCWATADDMGGKYVSDTFIKLSEKGKNASRILPTGAVLVTCIASIGKNAIAKIPLATNQQINSIVVNESFSNEFIYYLLTFKKHVLEARAGAGAMRILSKGEFMKIEFVFPDKEEQDAIAGILATADVEIDLLTHKQKKLQDQKKYLLNNLVTGQIRTPENL